MPRLPIIEEISSQMLHCSLSSHVHIVARHWLRHICPSICPHILGAITTGKISVKFHIEDVIFICREPPNLVNIKKISGISLEDLTRLYCCRRHMCNLAIKGFCVQHNIFKLLLNNAHRTHCCFSIETVITRNDHKVTL